MYVTQGSVIAFTFDGHTFMKYSETIIFEMLGYCELKLMRYLDKMTSSILNSISNNWEY